MTRCGFTTLALLCCLTGAATAHADAVALADEARSLATADPTPAGETRLNDIVGGLATRRDDPQARALLEELARREPQVFVRHTEGEAMIPLVDVGAAARAILRNWERQSAYDSTMLATRSAQPAFVARYLAAGDDARRGILDAVAQMDAAGLLPHRSAIRAAIDRPGGDALAAAAALSLSDTDLAADVIATGTDAVVRRLIPRIPAVYAEPAALRLLQSALSREAVASMALFRIDTLQSRQADTTIWNHLHDPGLGATAAAILARRGDRDTTRRLVELMNTAPAPLTRQRARLALTLSADPHARAIANEPVAP